MPGDRIPHSALPPAEIGTAQQEIPVAFTNYETTALILIFVISCVVGYVHD
jgi:hypothetical protein